MSYRSFADYAADNINLRDKLKMAFAYEVWNAALASVQTKEDVSCEKTEQSPNSKNKEE